MLYVSSISEREKQVIQLIAYEKTEQEIAHKLHISNNTVKSHKRRILDKLNAKNIAGIVRRGFELGLLNAQEEQVVYL